MKLKTISQLSNRLHRLQGQMAGLERMVQDNKYCVDIITQSMAVQKALQSFNQQILETHLHEHVGNQLSSRERTKAVKELVRIYYLNNK